MTTSQGALAARDVMLHLLATVKAEVADLSRTAPAKVVVLVNCTPEFDEQHLVANGATDLLIGVFGDERGRPARTPIGVAALPLGFAVEIEALFEMRAEG
jgi:enamine deaminase RidA (YjgF/YER057c/UK114 family)